MKLLASLLLLPLLLPLSAAQSSSDVALTTARILLATADSWAELYTRALYHSLVRNHHNVVLVGPADDDLQKYNSLGEYPTSYRLEPCSYDSCPPESGHNGTNATNPRMYWFNTLPVESARRGLLAVAPLEHWGRRPADLVVVGINTGNLFGKKMTAASAAFSIAGWAASVGYPAVVFSAPARRGYLPWNVQPTPHEALVYPELAALVVNHLVRSYPGPILPPGAFLHVNLPPINGFDCANAEDVRFVYTRLSRIGLYTQQDLKRCARFFLPHEMRVDEVGTGCYATISLCDQKEPNFHNKNITQQWLVERRLERIMTCWHKTRPKPKPNPNPISDEGA